METLFNSPLVISIAVPILSALFAVALFVLPFRSAVLWAVVVTASAASGTAIALLAQAAFFPSTLDTRDMVLNYLITSCATGILAAVIAGYVVLQRERNKRPNPFKNPPPAERE